MINHFAVFLAAVLHSLIGMAWYSFLFGKTWMKSLGIDPGTVDKARAKKEMPKTIGISFAGGWVLAYALAYLLLITNMRSPPQALFLAAVLWLGFVVATGINAVLYEKRPQVAFWINSSYELVAMALMAVLLALW